MEKLLIPCVYLRDGKLVKGFSDNTVISDDPAKYCTSLSVGGADSIILFDLSSSDSSHEEALLVIRKITESTVLDVYGAGNVNRLEDVKKLIYAGCRKVALNMAKSSNIELIEEAGKRFSKDRIISCADSLEQILDNLKVLKAHTSASILLGSLFVEGFEEIPVIPLLNDDTDITTMIKKACVYGISGDVINRKSEDLFSYKNELEALGVNIRKINCDLTWGDLKKNDQGLIPVICQDDMTQEVLMLAYMNEEAFEHTVTEGVMTYYSRSRSCLWKKGDTSGHYQFVRSLYYDCDSDTLLAKVVQIGNACHTGSHSCFFKEAFNMGKSGHDPYSVLTDVMNVILDRKENPKEGSYTNYLFEKGIDKILKKVGEEATEIVIAAKNPETEESKYEIADLLYHIMVLMAEKGITWDEVMTELANR